MLSRWLTFAHYYVGHAVCQAIPVNIPLPACKWERNDCLIFKKWYNGKHRNKKGKWKNQWLE